MLKLSKKIHPSVLMAVFWVLIATLGRVIPHPPNVTPLLGLTMLAGMQFNKKTTVLITLISMLMSDAVLSYIVGYQWLGSWSLFTYSGMAICALFASRLPVGALVSKQPILQSSGLSLRDCVSSRGNLRLVRSTHPSLRAKRGNLLIKIAQYTVGLSGLYWLWTNFGTWLCSSFYPHNLSGLSECFIAGLPFLRNAVFGDLVWTTALFIAALKFSPVTATASNAQ